MNRKNNAIHPDIIFISMMIFIAILGIFIAVMTILYYPFYVVKQKKYIPLKIYIREQFGYHEE